MPQENQSKISLWIPPIIWAGVIFSFSSLSITPTSEIFWKDFIIKKTAHIVEYAIFALLVYRALVGSGVAKTKSLVLSILLSTLYGVTDEIHQGFTPGREPKVRDVMIDSLGSTLGAYFYHAHNR